tara:strand:- start:21264 stop:21428 length:165 start_codon:yes stop_codon:yes gene_type:complete
LEGAAGFVGTTEGRRGGEGGGGAEEDEEGGDVHGRRIGGVGGWVGWAVGLDGEV